MRTKKMELDMTKGNPLGLIARFIVPILLGSMFQQLYSVMDTVIVGQCIGMEALAAVGATGTISFLILGFMQGLTTGFSILPSQRYGAGDLAGMKKSVGNAILLSAILTLVMTVVSTTGMDWLLTKMRTPADIYGLAKAYIVTICYGMGFTVLYNLLASILRAIGNSKAPLYFLVVSAVLNIILDLILITVFDMGVVGAAVATVASQGVSGLLCLFYIIRKVPILRIQASDLLPEANYIKAQLWVGIPMALQSSITAVGTILVQSALNRLGSLVVASYTVSVRVEEMLTLGYSAMGTTMATYSAQNYGLGDLERVEKGATVAFRILAVYSVVVFVGLQLFIPFGVRLFLSENVSLVIPYARTYALICGMFFLPMGMIFIYRNVMQGCGQGVLPMLGGVAELLGRAVVATIAARYESFEGVCMANASAWLLAGFFLWFAYRNVMRRLKRQALANTQSREQDRPLNQEG